MNTDFKKNIFLSRKLKNCKLKSFFFFSKNLQPKTYNLKPTRGFTLVEMLVSISVFLVVMTVATGSLLSIIDGNSKAQSIKSAMNNLNFALESMGKSIRIGSDYVGGSSCSTLNTCISFKSPIDLDKNGAFDDYVTFRWGGSGQGVERCDKINSSCSANDFVKLTAPEVAITDMKFYISPISSLPQRVLITVNGKAGSKSKTETVFNLQTTVSQR